MARYILIFNFQVKKCIAFVMEVLRLMVINPSICIVLLYQSGSGKTYTMWGSPSAMAEDPSRHSQQGIVPRIFRMLFSELERVCSTSYINCYYFTKFLHYGILNFDCLSLNC